MSQSPHGNIMILSPAASGGPAGGSAEVPPRVAVALAYLNALSAKTQAVVHEAGEFNRTEQPGQELTPHEGDTREVALATLDLYFSGKLEPCVWDRPQPPTTQPPAPDDGRPFVREADARGRGLPLLTICCPACNLNNSLHVGTRAGRKPPPDCQVCGNQRIVALARVEPAE